MSQPRRKAPPNTYWRGKTLWGRLQVNGEPYRWSLHTDNAAVAKRRLKAERDRLVASAHFGEQRHTYDAVFTQWGDFIVNQVGPETVKRYAVSLSQLAIDLRPMFIDEIDKLKVLDIIKRRREAGVSTATIRRDLTALSSVLEFACDHDYREGNPALDRLKRLKERRDPIALPEHAHIERVAKRAPPMLAAMIRTALASGCRQAELVNAERRNFDHDRRQLTVTGKGNKLRTVALDDATCATLRALPFMIGCKWLFWHPPGVPYSTVPNRFRVLARAELKAAQKAAQRAGQIGPDFRLFTFHHLRHRHAVDWLKAGRSIYDLQQRLGHTSITTTEIYLKFLTSEEQRAVKSGLSQESAHDQRFGAGDAS